MDYFQRAAGTAGVAGSTGRAATSAVAAASAAVQQPNLNMSDEMKRQLLIQQQQELQFQQQRLEQQLLHLQQKQMMGKLQQQQSQLRQQQQRQNQNQNQKVVPNQQPAATKLGNINSTNNASNFNSLFGTLSKIVGSFENPSAFDAYDAFSSAAASASATAAVSAGPVVDNSFPMIGLNNNNQELPQEEQSSVPLPRPNKRRRVTTAADINPTSSPYPPASRVGGKKAAVAATAAAAVAADINVGGDGGGNGDDSASGGDGVNRFRHYQADQWSTMLEELLSFKRKFGHCNVPHTSKEFPTLGRWVKRQRYQYKIMMDGKNESTMTPARVQVLERAGFIFDSHGSSWAQRFAELQQFKVEFGHCNVPSPYQSNPALSNWTKFQRRQIKKGLLSQDRIDALDAIGFQWELRKANKSSGDATTNDISNHGVDI
eukprot:CAMPEP_0113485136 /NCGR_PEP_ID=MMETSP0014_2-20120614/24327_1 /TAXON_ID=2857 /ORGANISM="Nitzschia sp." /LENGTH=430 /DNA_ID=CAMNT_0000378771 /DNA_START=97 /DNA_END=1389 /DNA_ORIENTATION=+ /assembly_acc=CAM_ASM_000159